MIAKIWACPTPECGNYYASSGYAGQTLDKEVTGDRGMNGEHTPEAGHSRAECPDCRARGRHVERIPVLVDIRSAAAISA